MLTIADYEEVLADHRRLVRELDVALSGEAGAAKQASLCDLIEQARQQRQALKIIAGLEQCDDNLMSNADVARAALGINK